MSSTDQPGVDTMRQCGLLKGKAACANVRAAAPLRKPLSAPSLAMPPSPGGKPALMDAEVRRGFRGELHHVRFGSELLHIRSGETGVELRNEA